MEKNIEYYFKKYNTLIKCIIFTFIIGMLSHSYMYFNNAISNDSLNEFITWDNVRQFKTETGRGLVVFYLQYIRGIITVPYLVGILSLVYISVSLYLISKIFDIKSDIILFMISAIMVLNMTVIALTATYIHDLDADMLSLLLATLSVFFLTKYNRGYIFGMIPLALSIGLYQAFISFAIILIIFKCILDLIYKENRKKVLEYGIKGILMIIGAGLFYLLLVKIIVFLTGINIAEGQYNSISKIKKLSFLNIIVFTIKTWIFTIGKLVNPPTILSGNVNIVVHILLLLLIFYFIIKKIIQNKIDAKTIFMVLLLVVITPIGMNISRVLMRDFSHDVMHYSIFMIYLLPLLFIDREIFRKDFLELKNKSYRNAVLLIIVFVMFGNFRFANTAYLIKDFEQDANMSLFTRINYDMNNIEGYVDGETPVAFVGRPLDQIRRNRDFTLRITGMSRSFVPYYSYNDRYKAYFNYVLMMDTKFVSEEEIDLLSEDSRVINMSVYPSKDSIKLIDGVLVVKLGNDLNDDY